MYNKEIGTDEINKEWVDNLQEVVDDLNNQTIEKIKLTPAEAIKLPKIELNLDVKSDELIKKEEALEGDVMVRYLYKPGEVEGDIKRRATDPNWSKTTHEIVSIMDRDDYNLYTLSDLPNKKYSASELMIIPL